MASSCSVWRRSSPDTIVSGGSWWYTRVSPLYGPLEGHGGERGRSWGTPRLGEAPPCPPGGDRRRWLFVLGLGRGFGAGARGGVGSRYLLLRISNASRSTLSGWHNLMIFFVPQKKKRAQLLCELWCSFVFLNLYDGKQMHLENGLIQVQFPVLICGKKSIKNLGDTFLCTGVEKFIAKTILYRSARYTSLQLELVSYAWLPASVLGIL